jgi:outer membrane protein assembly factor BamB
MLRFLRPHAPGALLAVALVLVLGVVACARDEPEAAEPALAPEPQSETQASAPPPAPPPPPPEAEITVLDGDTAKPVAGARVAVAGESAQTDGAGTASVALPGRKAVKVTVSAPGYVAREVRTRLREEKPRTVSVWRRASQWPMFGANPARTQVHAGIKLRPPFRTVWKRDFGSLLEFPAVVWEGTAYVNNIQGWVAAVSMKNGRVLWRKRVGTLMASSPALDPGRGILVVTTMRPGTVSVLDLETGRVRWSLGTGLTEPSPVIRKGVAYFGATNGNFYALDLDRRRMRWVFRGGAKITASPALVGNRLYFGDYAGRVFALSARTGRVVWRGSAGGRVYGTAAVAGGRVFVPSVFSGLSALSARNGRLLWRVPVGAYLYSSPAVFRGRVYFGTYARQVYSVDARSGRILWTRPAGGRVSGAVQVVAGIVYAAHLERGIRAWHWRTGREVWSFHRGKYVPISGNGARLLVHGSRKIWAMEPKRRQ